jgi:3-oxoacyl-[acyl-carrier protein] reductase
MEINFKGSSVLVTGGVRGIGRTIVRTFAENGANVWALDIEKKLLDEILSGLNSKIASRIKCVHCDVTNPREVEAVVSSIEDQVDKGSVDIAVHSAGGVRSRFKTPIEDVTDEDWRIIQSVNVDGFFNLSRAVVPGMKRNKKGRLIVISSRAGLGVSLTGVQSYGTAKAAQIGFVKQLSAELGQFGITVNSVAPGFMPTSPDYIKQWESYGDQGQAALVNSIAMRRVGRPEDIANATLFFASDLAEWVTGQTLAVTGGP